MPLLSLFRLIFGLISLLLLAATAYLFWTWYQGDIVRDADGDLVRVREDWRLWVGVALLAWSFLGRFALAPLLAKPDRGALSQARHGEGRHFTDATGASVYVEELGAAGGTPLILTHGAAADSTVWNLLKPDLARSFRVIAWDIPGLGKSRAAAGSKLSLSEIAANLAGVIERAGDQKVVLVGHSMGGMTIQTLAKEHPAVFADRVAGVVLIHTTYTNPLKTILFSPLLRALQHPLLEPMSYLTIWLQPLVWLGNWQSYLSGWLHVATRLTFGRYVTRSQLNHMTLLTTRNPPASQGKHNLAMFHWDATDVLPRIGVPVLVLAAELDIMTRPQASRTMAATIPGAQLQVIEGVNHMGFMERADVYTAAITKFAAQLAR